MIRDGLHCSHAPAFTFNMVKIPRGSVLEFVDAGLVVEVYDSKKVLYKGCVYSLSGFTKKFMPDAKRCVSDKYQGPKHFRFNGVLLTDLRSRAKA